MAGGLPKFGIAIGARRFSKRGKPETHETEKQKQDFEKISRIRVNRDF